MNRTLIMRECLGRALWLCLCPPIAGRAEDGRMTPLSVDSGDTADELISTRISLTGDNDYHSSSFNDASTRNHSPLIAEWVGVKAFSPTRTEEQPGCEGPRIASMELTEDIPSHVNTYATVSAGVYFRLIVFRKSGNDCVSQSAVDYASNGTGIPVLKQRELLTRPGTIRVAGYSFNIIVAADLGAMPASYTYNSSTVSIPNMNKDLMTSDSGDITSVNSLNHNLLSVSFSQKLCKLMTTISPTGFPSNTISNCMGVYIKQGGSSASWKIGPSSNMVVANTNNTVALSPNTTLSTTIRMVPFAGARTVTVHFNTLTVDGRIMNNNTEITSTQSIQLKGGKSYILKIQFKKGPGINALGSGANLTQNGCTAQNKEDLAKLIQADGNLKSTGDSNYVRTTSTDRGYYYTWYSTYTGNTSQNNTDSCSKLNVSTYGVGWHTSSRNELTKLSQCTNKAKINNGMWFMNNSKELFLPLAGHTPSAYGVSTGNGAVNSNLDGNYWYTEEYYRFLLGTNGHIVSNAGSGAFGCFVRCAKGTKQ